MNCNDGRYNCGTKVSSACVNWSEKSPITSFDLTTISCEPNLNDIIKNLDIVIKTIQNSIDLTGLDKECLTYNPTTITVAELSQLYTTELCAIKAQIQTLQDDLANLNILNQPISIDVSCLFGSNNCQPTTQTIGTLLNLLVSEVCTLKTQING